MTSPRLAFYASNIRTRQQAEAARADREYWAERDKQAVWPHSFPQDWRAAALAKRTNPTNLITRPLDDEPQEYDPFGNAMDEARDEYERENGG